MNAVDRANRTTLFVDAILPGDRPREGSATAVIGENLWFSTEGLERYFFSDWRPDLFDLLVIAGAVEFCDLVHSRPGLAWARKFDVQIAVHNPELWNTDIIKRKLISAVAFLTGDIWNFTFVQRATPAPAVKQSIIPFSSSASVIMPYSDGLDSRAVAAIVQAERGRDLVRVRLGNHGVDCVGRKKKQPFAVVPYEVKVDKRQRRESSARSRGFKFAVVTGIAATLANVNEIVVTESGQGAIGPVLTVTGHAYPDYRVHPTFTNRMENLFESLTGQPVQYVFPRLWSTKGETLRTASTLREFKWENTRSCWQQSRQVSVDGKRRQCGVCAACMLRRMSMYTAQLHEAPDTYVWERLNSATIRGGAALGFRMFTAKLDQYAIAGTLHLDHLAATADTDIFMQLKKRAARELSHSLKENEDDISLKLNDLLRRHKLEWLDFLTSLGPESFVTKISSVRP